MPISISYSKKKSKNQDNNLVLFTNEKFSTNYLNKYLSKSEFSYVSDLLKTSDLKKNILVFEISSKKKIILVSIKTNRKSLDAENLGAEFFGRINIGKKVSIKLFQTV